MSADLPSAGDVQDLTASLNRVHTTLRMEQERVQRLEEQIVPREEHRRQRKRTIVVAVIVLAAVVLGGLLTFQAGQRDFSRQVLTCFLRPGAVTVEVAQACDRRFSPERHEYLELQQQGQGNLRRFADLQEWAKEHGWKPPAEPEE